MTVNLKLYMHPKRCEIVVHLDLRFKGFVRQNKFKVSMFRVQMAPSAPQEDPNLIEEP